MSFCYIPKLISLEVLFLAYDWYTFWFSPKFVVAKQMLLTFSIHELKVEPF